MCVLKERLMMMHADTEIKWLDAARKCCDVARSDGCQLSCLDRNAGSRSVHRDCQDETDFFNCLQHQQVKPPLVKYLQP